MKVEIVPHNPLWKSKFLEIKGEVQNILSVLSPKIEHIGSTSIDELWAKPVIDVLVGIDEINLDETTVLLKNTSYVYVKAFTEEMPERRFFIRLKDGYDFKQEITTVSQIDENINSNKIAHIHIVGHNSEFWFRHMAFREYLKAHQNAKEEYQQLKKKLSEVEWNHPFEFNEAKSAFIQLHQSKAISWYKNQLENGNKI
ncbi:MAG: hypothetical protein OHK0057_23570 [Thermoflexibacter sp.]